MNPIDYLQKAFIWLTQLFVYAALWFYGYVGLPGFLGDLAEFLGDFFNECSDATANVAGHLWMFSNLWDYVAERVDEILTWQNIKDLFKAWLPDLPNVISWFQTRLAWFTTQVTTWWATTTTTVKGWIDVAVQGWVAFQKVWSDFWNITFPQWTNTISKVASDLSNFFTVILPGLVTSINLSTWWDSRLLDVQGLIDSSFKIWLPFYDDLVSLWGEIKEFFADPEDWLYKAFDRIIERFW